jgi:hypothetical protein
MPFFASASGPTVTKPRATRSRAHSPTPAKRAKAPTDYRSPKAEAKKQPKQDYIPREQYYSDCESRPDSEKTFVDIKSYLVGIQNQPQMPGPRPAAPAPDRSEYGRQERDRGNRPGPPRNAPPRQSGDPNEILHLDLDDVTNRVENTYLGDSQPFPVTSIYEQILLLRQHGAGVKFGPKSRSDCLRDELPQAGQSIRRGGSPVSLTDIHSPGREDINAIDYALASVINAGGEVEFHPLPHRQSGGQLECAGCSKVFALQQDRDEHIGGGSLKCNSCGIPLYCRGLVEDHMHKKHRARNSGSLASDDRPSFGGHHDRSDSQSWATR